MFAAAAEAVAGMIDVSKLGAPLLPPVENLRAISEIVAIEVAKAAVSDGVARIKHEDIKQAVRNAMWEPVYRPIKAAKETVMV